MVHRVLVIGAGKIGLKHIDSLRELSLKNSLRIHVDIKDKQDLTHLEKDYLSQNFSLTYSATTGEFRNQNYVLAIISTTADARIMEFEQASDMCTFESVLLEKPLATNIKELKKFLRFRRDQKIYVNLSREFMGDFRQLKAKFHVGIRKISIIGGQINLASNSLHYLRLIEWLTNSRISNLSLDNSYEIVLSRHKGYLELIGKLFGKTSNNCSFEVTSMKNTLPTRIEIVDFDSKAFEYIEYEGSDNLPPISIGGLHIELQSQLTSRYFLQILKGEELNLPKLYDVVHIEKLTIPIFAAAGIADIGGKLNIH